MMSSTQLLSYSHSNPEHLCWYLEISTTLSVFQLLYQRIKNTGFIPCKHQRYIQLLCMTCGVDHDLLFLFSTYKPIMWWQLVTKELCGGHQKPKKLCRGSLRLQTGIHLSHMEMTPMLWLSVLLSIKTCIWTTSSPPQHWGPSPVQSPDHLEYNKHLIMLLFIVSHMALSLRPWM